jgi:hypothetical protein
VDVKDHTRDRPSSDYFSLPAKQSEPAPQQVPHVAHGFTPLCSVAAVENEDENKGYFVLPGRRSSLLSGWLGIVESSERTASAPIPSTAEETQVAFDDLRHPTVIPLLERNVLSSPDDSPLETLPRLRGGGALDLDEEVREHETLIKEIEEVLNLWEENVTEYICKGKREYKASLSATSSYSSDGACDGHDMPPESTAKDTEDSSSDTESCYSDIKNLIDKTANSDESLSTSSRLERAVSYATLKREHDFRTADGITQSLEQFFEDSPTHSDKAIYPQPLPAPSHNSHTDEKISGASTTLPPLSPVDPATNFATPQSVQTPPSNPSTLYKLASQTPTIILTSLLLPPYASLVIASTRKIYIPSVPIRMLEHFCGVNTIERLVPRYSRSRDVLEIPDTATERSGIVRVIRFMRRCCLPSTHTSYGDLRVPPDLKEGIETVRACWVLGLEADAERIEALIVRKWMAQSTWCMAVEHMVLIWDGYFGSLQDTGFGDAVVWFTLMGMQDGTLSEEIRRMLELEGYVGLKGRVESERASRIWKGEDRDGFLDRCKMQREAQKDIVSKLRRARFLRSARSVEVDKPLPLRIEKKVETDIKTRLDHGLLADSDHAPASVIVREKPLPRASSNPNVTCVDGILPLIKRTPSFPIMPPSPGYTYSDAFENPRKVPSLRKQRSLWDKLRTSV